MATTTHLVAIHPATDTAPRAFVALYDPTADVTPAEPTPMGCWVVGCDCGDTYPLEPTTTERLAELIAESAHNPPPRRRQRPNGPSRGGSPRPDGPRRSRGVSLADAVLGDGGSHGAGARTVAHPGDVPYPLWPDEPGGAR